MIVAAYLTWKTGDHLTHYRVTFDEHESKDPGSFHIEQRWPDRVGGDSWRPVGNLHEATSGKFWVTWEYRTLPSLVMSKLVEGTLDWAKRMHDWFRDTQRPPSDGSGTRNVPHLNRETEVFEYRKEKMPRSEMNMLPPGWDRTENCLTIQLGTFEAAP